jgi:hypothetical protein
VAHISRTAKWHLNAIAALRKALDRDGSDENGTQEY